MPRNRPNFQHIVGGAQIILRGRRDDFRRCHIPPAPKVHAKDPPTLRLIVEFTRNTVGTMPNYASDGMISRRQKPYCACINHYFIECFGYIANCGVARSHRDQEETHENQMVFDFAFDDGLRL